MESWIRIVSYILRRLLRNILLLKDVRMLEYAVNTSMDVQAELQKRQDDEKSSQLEKRIRDSSDAGSKTSTATGLVVAELNKPRPAERKPIILET